MRNVIDDSAKTKYGMRIYPQYVPAPLPKRKKKVRLSKYGVRGGKVGPPEYNKK